MNLCRLGQFGGLSVYEVFRLINGAVCRCRWFIVVALSVGSYIANVLAVVCCMVLVLMTMRLCVCV